MVKSGTFETWPESQRVGAQIVTVGSHLYQEFRLQSSELGGRSAVATDAPPPFYSPRRLVLLCTSLAEQAIHLVNEHHRRCSVTRYGEQCFNHSF